MEATRRYRLRVSKELIILAYELMSTSNAPALIIYLLDLSASMAQPLNGRQRIDVVRDALSAAIRQMVFRSTKGGRISPRYRIALYAYSDHVYDVLDGIKPVDEVVAMGMPPLVPLRTTDTARGFAHVEKLLQKELPSLTGCPAPLVCHMTDGEFTGEDPEPIVRRIMQMSVPDGSVLVENIFISEGVLASPIADPTRWPGVLPDTPLADDYAHKLRAISSPLPESYRLIMLEHHFHLEPGALMLLPGMSPELVAMGLQMSASTPVR